LKEEKSAPLPCTLEEVAKALQIPAEMIRSINSFHGGYEIRFKPSFKDHEHMEKISKQLRINDVENIYLSLTSNPHLSIYQQGAEDFIRFVKKQQNATSEEGDNQNSGSFSSRGPGL
jgi:hypothetical protein